MACVIDLNTVRVKKEKLSVWEKLKYKAIKTYWWAKENPAEAAIVGTIITTVITGGVRVTKGLVRSYNIHQEAYNKERYVYDHSLGAYLKTNRRLTNNDIVEINRRMGDGKKKAEVLAEMGLLE